jgi:hypothetical protein
MLARASRGRAIAMTVTRKRYPVRLGCYLQVLPFLNAAVPGH